MALRDLALTDASVPETASLAEAVAELFEARVPAVAVLDESRSVLGVLSERDVLGAVFPGYLAEIRHSAKAASSKASAGVGAGVRASRR